MPNNAGRKKYYVGRKEMMNCGMVAEILEYQDCHHLVVRFEDGTILTREPIQFTRRSIRNPNIPRAYCIGDRKTATNGMEMEIVELIDNNNVRIRFSDGLTKKITKSSWRTGMVSHPKHPRKGRSSFIGQIKTKDGHTAKCIGVKDKDHLIVEFDNGEHRVIVSSCFTRESFLYPHESLSELNSKRRKCSFRAKFVGVKKLNRAGLEMECIEASSHDDVTVRFTQSGFITHCDSRSFTQGTLVDRIAESQSFIGKTVMQLNGLPAKITEYSGPTRNLVKPLPAKYRIEFPDGFAYENEGMKEFNLGRLKHPDRPMATGSVYHGIKIFRKEFYLGTEPQMKCQCTKCGWMDIASFSEIQAHSCKTQPIV